MKTSSKILCFILTLPLLIIGIIFSVLTTCILPIVLPVLSLITLIGLIKHENRCGKTFLQFLRSWCLFGIYVYFNLVWDYKLFRL